MPTRSSYHGRPRDEREIAVNNPAGTERRQKRRLQRKSGSFIPYAEKQAHFGSCNRPPLLSQVRRAPGCCSELYFPEAVSKVAGTLACAIVFSPRSRCLLALPPQPGFIRIVVTFGSIGVTTFRNRSATSEFRHEHARMDTWRDVRSPCPDRSRRPTAPSCLPPWPHRMARRRCAGRCAAATPS